MKPNTTLKAVDSITAAGEALAEAEKLAAAVAADQKKAAAMTPALVDQLVSAGLLDVSERDLARTKLADHAGSLQLLGNVLRFHQTQKTAYEQKLAAAGPGQATEPTTKTASAPPTSVGGAIDGRSGYGQRRGSDEALLRRLNLI